MSNNNLVTDDMVSSALRYLAENTQATAKAKADRVLAELNRKRCRARLILASPESSYAMREAWAEAHDDYEAACVIEAQATEADEYHRAARVKADAIISAWQTENANIRAAERVR
jgi:hypothetical protein